MTEQAIGRSTRISLPQIFWIFLKVGATAFGGFMALIAVVENLVVERRGLLTHEDLLDGISLASMLPGPVAVNVVTYVGYRLRGVGGALFAWFAVIIPSFVLLLGLTIVYFRWGQMPAMSKIFMGFIPAVTAIIFYTAWGMAKKSVTTTRESMLLFAAALLLLVIGGFFITVLVILGAGVLGYVLFRGEETNGPSVSGRARAHVSVHGIAAFPAALIPLSVTGKIAALFLTFSGMSLMLFGGGYVFIPMIKEIVVSGHHWVTGKEFIDAIALGQVTPGPILISAAFIGYKVAGFAGALVSTVGIFLPPAIVTILCATLLEKLKRSPTARSALRGIRAAVTGMIFAAAVVIGSSAQPGWASFLIFCAALLALARLRIEVVWLIPLSGIAGLILY